MDSGQERGDLGFGRVEPIFWHGRRVFVTGCTGFKGSWLCAWLLEMGAEVSGYARAPRFTPCLFDGLGLRQKVAWTEGDVADRDRLSAALRDAEPEIVLHLAAQPIVLTALEEPAETVQTNVIGTLNLLEAVRRQGDVRAMVCVTSDKCYREPHGACREDDPLGGDEPYGASKACAEILVAAWRASYLRAHGGIGLGSARAGNVIGGGDFSRHRLIPDMVRAAMAARAPTLRHPDATRPWQHVLDALQGYLLLAQALHAAPEAHATAWNFGPPAGWDWPVRQVAAAVERALGGLPWQLDPAPVKGEAAVQRLSPERAMRRLGWFPRLDTAQAVAWTVEGYSAFLETGTTDWLGDQLDRYGQLLRSAHARPDSVPAELIAETRHGVSTPV